MIILHEMWYRSFEILCANLTMRNERKCSFDMLKQSALLEFASARHILYKYHKELGSILRLVVLGRSKNSSNVSTVPSGLAILEN